MRKLTLIVGSLAIAVSGCSKQPVATASSHPPALDLVCQAEPSALTDAEVIADVAGVAEQAFNDTVLIAGRACRDALRRVCEWHHERGMVIDCGKP